MDLIGMVLDGHGAVALIGAALLLGALHALEPGHSKTMIAAYIAGTRGTAAHAVALGLSSAAAHTAMVWLVAMVALLTDDPLVPHDAQPWAALAGGLLMAAMGAWLAVSATGGPARALAWLGDLGHRHGHAHPHGHHDHDHPHHHYHHHHGHDHGDHGHHHPAADAHGAAPMLDPHTRAHAEAVRAALDGAAPTLRRAAVFGLSGGLLPCPAAIAVLLMCLQADRPALGVGLVAALSLGVAATLVAVGLAASSGRAVLSGRWPIVDRLMERLPAASGALILVLGLAMAWSGWTGVGHVH